MLGKDKLVFDTTVTLSENDNVGAFLRASDGTLLTHTGGALNVNVANSVTVTATDLDIRNLSASQDNVAISDGTDTLAINNDGSINITDNGGSITVDGTVSISGNVNVTQGTSPWVVQAGAEKAEDSAHSSGAIGNFVLGVRNDSNASLTSADGDYSPLATDSAGRLKVVATFTSNTEYAEDSAFSSGNIGDYVLAVRQDTLSTDTSADGDYSSFKVNALGALYTEPVGNVADDAADSGRPVKVGSRAEAGALSAVSDGDRADLLSDDYRRIYVNSGANIGVEETAVTVTTSATALPASALAGRRKIYIQNLSGQEIFLGGSGVTTTNGLRIAAGAVFEDEVGDDVTLYAIKATGTANVRVLELA